MNRMSAEHDSDLINLPIYNRSKANFEWTANGKQVCGKGWTEYFKLPGKRLRPLMNGAASTTLGWQRLRGRFEGNALKPAAE